MKYEPPEFKKEAFTCPHCDVYVHFRWVEGKEQVMQHRVCKLVRAGLATH